MTEQQIADDGTPVSDLLDQIREMRDELQQYKRDMQTIVNMCNAPHWNADRRWKIRDIADSARKKRIND